LLTRSVDITALTDRIQALRTLILSIWKVAYLTLPAITDGYYTSSVKSFIFTTEAEGSRP
jgi:hypothetical protein